MLLQFGPASRRRSKGGKRVSFEWAGSGSTSLPCGIDDTEGKPRPRKVRFRRDGRNCSARCLTSDTGVQWIHSRRTSSGEACTWRESCYPNIATVRVRKRSSKVASRFWKQFEGHEHASARGLLFLILHFGIRLSREFAFNMCNRVSGGKLATQLPHTRPCWKAAGSATRLRPCLRGASQSLRG